jgi:hypothetical protein
MIFLLICRGCVDKADVNGVYKVEGGLKNYNVKFEIIK